MRKQDCWSALYVRVFSMSPSGWALFAGALAGLAINILTGMRLDASPSSANKVLVYLSIISFSISAILFGWMSVTLEEYREGKELSRLIMTLRAAKPRAKVLRLALTGTILLVTALVLFFSA